MLSRLLLSACAALALSSCAPRLQPSFDPAVQPRADDLGPHGDLMEWWYLSGYLPAQKLAFHWAQFKVSPPNFPTDVFFSHVAVTDLTTGKVTFLEQNESPQLGTGKASYPPLKLRDGDWTFEQTVSGPRGEFKLNAGPLRLTLLPQKPPVIHPPGYSGVPELTGAMYYQSITRLGMGGTVAGKDVTGGVAWLDHQWGGMSAGTQARWDWLSAHMDGGEDLMLYRVLLPGGKVVQTFGTITDQAGQVRAATNVVMEPGRVWKSATGRDYVLDWHVRAGEFDLNVKAAHDDQELVSKGTRIVYWEGPVELSGTWRGQPGQGSGMMELVAGSLDSKKR